VTALRSKFHAKASIKTTLSGTYEFVGRVVGILPTGKLAKGGMIALHKVRFFGKYNQLRWTGYMRANDAKSKQAVIGTDIPQLLLVSPDDFDGAMVAHLQIDGGNRAELLGGEFQAEHMACFARSPFLRTAREHGLKWINPSSTPQALYNILTMHEDDSIMRLLAHNVMSKFKNDVVQSYSSVGPLNASVHSIAIGVYASKCKLLQDLLLHLFPSVAAAIRKAHADEATLTHTPVLKKKNIPISNDSSMAGTKVGAAAGTKAASESKPAVPGVVEPRAASARRRKSSIELTGSPHKEATVAPEAPTRLKKPRGSLALPPAITVPSTETAASEGVARGLSELSAALRAKYVEGTPPPKPSPSVASSLVSNDTEVLLQGLRVEVTSLTRERDVLLDGSKVLKSELEESRKVILTLTAAQAKFEAESKAKDVLIEILKTQAGEWRDYASGKY
jgi:hypothetical protein